MEFRSGDRDRDRELRLASAMVLLGGALFLVMAHAYISEAMTEVLIRAKHASEKSAEKPPEITPELQRKDVPPDFEVRNAAQVEQINAGKYPSFEAGQDD